MSAIIITLIGFLLSPICQVDSAQQAGKIPRIGYLTGSPLAVNTDRIEALRRGLRELGYIEGKNIVIEWRSGDGKRERVKPAAQDLVRLMVDVIVAASDGVARDIAKLTSTIPIVMASADDPVGSGLVASLARPGGNVTGLSQVSPELNGKRLEILKEIVPKLSRLAVFGTRVDVGDAQDMKEIERAAAGFGVKTQNFDVETTKDLNLAFQAAVKGRVEAVLDNVSGRIRRMARKEYADLAIKHGLPVMYSRGSHVETGGLVAYGVNITDLDHRAATYVDKILKGAKPADLPVEQPKKFEFIVNLKAAKQIGLTIPPQVLARADRVIR